MIKRAFDVWVSFLALLTLAPLFLLVALIVPLESRGPAFYVQERVGRYGKPFKLWKFRTMQVNADRQAAITIGRRDSRITRIGYWLRKFKIDELPQLINVLLGEMSLVGPRPEVKKFVDLYTPQQLQVLTRRPGLTDFASIEFRNENELLEDKQDAVKYYIEQIMPRKLHLNQRYLLEQSFWVDLKILVRTVLLIVGRK